MKLWFTVPFNSDPNKVKKIFKKIELEMLQDPVLGEDFLQPFKSQGVLEIDDVGMMIRGKFMAKPGKQFMIRKEIDNRVSATFVENCIPFGSGLRGGAQCRPCGRYERKRGHVRRDRPLSGACRIRVRILFDNFAAGCERAMTFLAEWQLFGNSQLNP